MVRVKTYWSSSSLVILEIYLLNFLRYSMIRDGSVAFSLLSDPQIFLFFTGNYCANDYLYPEPVFLGRVVWRENGFLELSRRRV